MQTLIWTNKDLNAPLRPFQKGSAGGYSGPSSVYRVSICVSVFNVYLCTHRRLLGLCMSLFMQHHRKLVHFTGFLKIVLAQV